MAGSHGRAFDGPTFRVVRDFFAFTGSPGGVSVAAAELDGSGTLKPLIGSGAGRASDVQVLRLDGSVAQSFAPFGGFAGGVNLG